MQFDPVFPEHFKTLSRIPFPHTLIDKAIQQIGTETADANQFRYDVFAAAGWKYGNVTVWGKYPDEAANVFNKIRFVIQDTADPAQILSILKAGVSLD